MDPITIDMPASVSVSAHSLERAYQFIKANQLYNAELVLDAVVRVEPQNVEAWKTYLWITHNQSGLDWLKERVLKARELSEVNKTEIINYYFYLTQQLNTQDDFSKMSSLVLRHEEQTEENAKGSDVEFELINVFDYPIQAAMLDPRRRPQRVMYNFVSDMADGILKAASSHPTGKIILAYIENGIKLVREAAKDPKEAYAQFARSPYFEKTYGGGLLVLFITGARLSMSNVIGGYILLGLFVIASGWWLPRFLNRNMAPFNNQLRVYLQENKNNLVVIKKVVPEQGKGVENKNIQL